MNPLCPYLPALPDDEVLDHSLLARHGSRRDAAFYFDALLYGHFLWQQGHAGRALLALTRALYADLDPADPILRSWPLPYQALAWIIQHHVSDDFPGNPRLSYQHQACRLRGPRAELRSARAWAVWALVTAIRPHLPGDPSCPEHSIAEITARLEQHGHPQEAQHWQQCLAIFLFSHFSSPAPSVTSTAMSHHAVMIAGTGSYVPEKILTNAELEKRIETSDEWITTRTGIKERRIAAADEFTSHMATKAGLRALEQAGILPEDVQLIIVATITPDTLTPATACYVQENLGARRAIAFDLSAACSGFLYAMEVAQKMISGGAVENALIIGAEKLSAFVNWNDRGTCILFGDGAGAAVLRAAKPGEGRILAMDLGTDGSLTHLLNIPGGGSAQPITPENADEHLATLAMLGKEVFKHAVTRMKNAAETVITRAGLQPQDIACVIPHQANLRIIDAIADRLAVPNEKVFVNLHHYGNTSAAAVAIALDEAHRSGAFQRGENIVLVVFGAGLTWAAAAIQW